MRYLALNAEDAAIADAVMESQAKTARDRDKSQADYLAARTAGLTTQGITRWLRNAFK